MPGLQNIIGPRKGVDRSIEATQETGFELKKELGLLDMVAVGIAVMIGAGIFILTGTAAADGAGPGITVSYILAAVICAFCALSYAELSAMVPVAGSAYTFSYATLGQLVAFIIGWDLVLEFAVGASAVGVGAGGFINEILDQVFGVTLPEQLIAGPFDGGVVNIPAVLVIALLGALLYRGVKQTARATAVLVGITLAVVVLVIIVGAFHIDTANWDPFFPGGFDGVVTGASLVFFAFIGFDAVATTAEESKNPQRDAPRGILLSLGVVTILYVLMAAAVTGMLAYTELTGDAPVADAISAAVDSKLLVTIIFVGSLFAVGKTVLNLMLGQTRIAFAMSRDHMLPRALGKTHERYGTPYKITVITTIVVMVLAALAPLEELSRLVSIGTLFAFMLVSAGVIVLRRTDPDRERPFKAPLVPLIPILAIVGSVWLASKLEGGTWIRFIGWMALGLVVYVVWTRSQATRALRDQGAEV